MCYHSILNSSSQSSSFAAGRKSSLVSISVTVAPSPACRETGMICLHHDLACPRRIVRPPYQPDRLIGAIRRPLSCLDLGSFAAVKVCQKARTSWTPAVRLVFRQWSLYHHHYRTVLRCSHESHHRGTGQPGRPVDYHCCHHRCSNLCRP